MNPFRLFFARCRRGFTAWQKVLITAALIAYIASPVQLLPNSIRGLGLLDDAFVFFCMGRVWASPLVQRRTQKMAAASSVAPSVGLDGRPAAGPEVGA